MSQMFIKKIKSYLKKNFRERKPTFNSRRKYATLLLQDDNSLLKYKYFPEIDEYMGFSIFETQDKIEMYYQFRKLEKLFNIMNENV